MNNKISKLLAVGALTMGLMATSCADNWEPANVGQPGTLSLKSLGVSVNTSSVVQSRAGEIDLNPFLVTIVPLGGGTAQEYVYGTMPELITLEPGQYRVDVESHKVQKAEWDKPYYKGSSSEVTIKTNEITEIGNVTCEFSSLQVSVHYTDELSELLGDDVTVTVTANDEGTLVYTRNETRSGYFEVVDGSTTLAATFSGKVAGSPTTQTVTFTNVHAGVHYMITFKVKAGPDIPTITGGMSSPTITVEGELSEEDVNGTVDPGEDPLLNGDDRPGQENPVEPDPGTGGGEPNPPAGDAITFESTTLNLDGVNDATGWTGDAIVTIKAEAGIEHLVVKIDSEGLTAGVLEGVGLVQEFDLAYPAQSKNSAGETLDITEGLAGLGFPVGAQVIGQTEVKFDITQFVPLLCIYPGNSNFVITVTDKNGAKKGMTLKFKS